MLNLAEYRNKSDRLADHLPWAALVAPGVVLNKDGSFQRTFRFRGPDLESATEAELVAACARVNNVLRRLGSGWALFFEADRFAAAGYPQSEFPDPASWLVDEERRAQFEDGILAGADEIQGTRREHYENAYYLTLLYMAPPDHVARAERALIDTGADDQKRDWRHELDAYIAETNRTLDLLSQVMAEIAPLDDGETLTYLHRTISTKRHTVEPPAEPIYLDAILADQPLHGGLEPMLGEAHLRTLTILGFPNTTRPGLLDALRRIIRSTSDGARCEGVSERPSPKRSNRSRPSGLTMISTTSGSARASAISGPMAVRSIVLRRSRLSGCSCVALIRQPFVEVLPVGSSARRARQLHRRCAGRPPCGG